MDRRFKQLILIAGALTVVVESLSWFYVPSSDDLLGLWAVDGYDALIDGGLPIYILQIAARFLILAGLFAFHPLARTLFLFYIPLVALGSLAWGWRVTPPIQGPFIVLEFVADGVILGLAYYSSVAGKFREKTDA